MVGEPAAGSWRPAGPPSTRCRKQADPGRVFGLYLPRAQTCLTVKTREPAATERLVAAGFFRPEDAGLSVTILHELLFREALGLGHEDAERHVDYAKSVRDALDALLPAAGTNNWAPSSTRRSSTRCAPSPTSGEVMPQKSTYFYPKLLTGLVYDALGD